MDGDNYVQYNEEDNLYNEYLKQTHLSLGLSSLCLLSFSASSLGFCTASGLLLMRNLFSGMGGISSGRTVDVTTSSCSFSSALSASELVKHKISRSLSSYQVGVSVKKIWEKKRYLFFSFFFCFFFSFFAFFLRFLDSFSDSSDSEEESDELSESLELLLELEEARSLFFASFFAVR